MPMTGTQLKALTVDSAKWIKTNVIKSQFNLDFGNIVL